MISRIKIDNFKSIKKLDLELKAINILIGSNGAGKSNFIAFFKLLKYIYEDDLKIHIADEAGANNIFHFGLKVSDFLGGTIWFDAINGYEFRLKPNLDNGLYFEYEHVYFHKSGYDRPYVNPIGDGSERSNLKTNDNPISEHVNKYMNSFRIFHFHDTGKTAKIKLACNVSDNRYLREDGSNLAAFLYFIQERYPKDFARIEMEVRAVAPYFERFILQPDRINPEIIRLEWKEKGSDVYFNARHLSDGTLRFIALATLLLQPQTPPIVLIDEPELGLHPFAINKLSALMMKVSSKTQIIVSTQSVNLLDNFTPEEIITVDRENNQSVFNRHSSIELKEWLDGYCISELWNKNVIGGRP